MPLHPLLLAETVVPPLPSQNAMVWIFLAAGVAVLAVLGRFGYLRPSHIVSPTDPPTARRAGLGAMDYGTVFLALALGVWLVSQIRPAFPQLFIVQDNGEIGYRSPWAMGVVMALGQLLTMGPATAVWLWRLHVVNGPDAWRRVGLRVRTLAADLKLAAIGFLVAVLLTWMAQNAAALVGEWIGSPPAEMVDHVVLKQLIEAVSTHNHATTALFIFSAVILAPLLEELLFRGIIQTAVAEMAGPGAPRVEMRWLAVLVTSVLFVLSHISVGSWHMLAPLFALSLVLGWLYERHGRLSLPIFVHMGFNALNIVLTLLIATAGPGS